MAGKGSKFPCIKCDAHVKKNDKAVQCSLCDLWIHVDCAGMKPETYKLICNLADDGMDHCWSCQCCRNAVHNLNKRILDISKRVTTVEGTMKEHTEQIGGVDKRVEKLESEVKSMKETNHTEAAADNAKEAIFNELNDNDNRKDNLVIHNLKEPDISIKGADRKTKDLESLAALFGTIDCRLDPKVDIKFCFRVGEPQSNDQTKNRPLIVGFRNREKREYLTVPGSLLQQD